ncbi:MAG: hypothetical protein QOJ92_2581 [Frankiales bacterium]|nr:hypothetical protein [Frankiales bacterium]
MAELEDRLAGLTPALHADSTGGDFADVLRRRNRNRVTRTASVAAVVLAMVGGSALAATSLGGNDNSAPPVTSTNTPTAEPTNGSLIAPGDEAAATTLAQESGFVNAVLHSRGRTLTLVSQGLDNHLTTLFVTGQSATGTRAIRLGFSNREERVALGIPAHQATDPQAKYLSQGSDGTLVAWSPTLFTETSSGWRQVTSGYPGTSTFLAVLDAPHGVEVLFRTCGDAEGCPLLHANLRNGVLGAAQSVAGVADEDVPVPGLGTDVVGSVEHAFLPMCPRGADLVTCHVYTGALDHLSKRPVPGRSMGLRAATRSGDMAYLAVVDAYTIGTSTPAEHKHMFFTPDLGRVWAGQTELPGDPAWELNGLSTAPGRVYAYGTAGRLMTKPEGGAWSELKAKPWTSTARIFGVWFETGNLVVVAADGSALSRWTQGPDGWTHQVITNKLYARR